MISQIGADDMTVLMMRGTYPPVLEPRPRVRTEKHKMRTYVIKVITLGWSSEPERHGRFAVWMVHQARNKVSLHGPEQTKITITNANGYV